MVRIETEKGLKNNSKSQYIQHPVFGKQDRGGGKQVLIILVETSSG